jgi:hypothetical protein
VDTLEAPLECHPLTGEQAPDDLEGLAETRGAMIEGDVEGAKLRLVPPGTKPEYESSATDLLDGSSLPGQQTWR